MFNKEIGKKLVLVRKKSNLTQQDVAKRMGIKGKGGRSFIAQLENGLIKNPGVRTLFNYLLACDASWPNLLERLKLTI